ncbi:MAG: DMT family transporter [Gammaproteobacteria bacterium]|nr:MAG: DMT family transporter [Gammaproteobacteria bacterium]
MRARSPACQPMSADSQRTLLGVSLMSLAMFSAAGIDISVKALTSGFDTPQIVLLRSLFALPVVLLICRYQSGLRSLATPRWGWQIYRGFLTAGANFGFFYALAHVPIVTALLLSYIGPVLIVLLSRPLLGERVGLHQWLGISVAFTGVVVVLRPDSLYLPPAALAIFGSALCWALLSISNRRLAGIEPTGVLAFYTVPISALLAGLLTVGEWTAPAGTDWLLFAIAGGCGASAHLLVAMAYRHANAAVIAPFEYTALIWISLAGYLFWSEKPDAFTWLGGAAVIFGGWLAMRSRE